MSYNKTTWINDVTPLNDKNLNNIEKGIDELSISVKYMDSSISTMNKTLNGLVLSNDGKADISDLKALKLESATISDLTALRGDISSLTSDNATIKNLISDKASIESLNSVNASIINLKAESAKVTELVANKATIDQLKAVSADIEMLYSTSATIEELTATTAKINEIFADYITTDVLEAATANIGTLTADVGDIKNLIAGNISSENILTGGITSDKLTIADAFIKDAMIDTISANKLNAGQIDTSVVNIISKSGNLKICDNTIQIKDNNNKVRVQIGKDNIGDYSLSVWDELGNLMFDARGLKEDAFKDSIIRDDMISEDANISGEKLNINSVISSINDDGTTLLKATKIHLDEDNQTLEVSFKNLQTVSNDNAEKVASSITRLEVAEGEISTLISESLIEKDGETIKLKDAYIKTDETVKGLSTTVAEHSSTIDENTGKITSVESNVATYKQEIDGFLSRLESTEKKVETIEGITNSYKLEVISTNGNILTSSSSNTILKAIVRLGTEDITSTINSDKFIWKRTSNDTVGDTQWNLLKGQGVKEIVISTSDIANKATFTCELLE